MTSSVVLRVTLPGTAPDSFHPAGIKPVLVIVIALQVLAPVSCRLKRMPSVVTCTHNPGVNLFAELLVGSLSKDSTRKQPCAADSSDLLNYQLTPEHSKLLPQVQWRLFHADQNCPGWEVLPKATPHQEPAMTGLSQRILKLHQSSCRMPTLTSSMHKT